MRSYRNRKCSHMYPGSPRSPPLRALCQAARHITPPPHPSSLFLSFSSPRVTSPLKLGHRHCHAPTHHADTTIGPDALAEFNIYSSLSWLVSSGGVLTTLY